MNLSTVKWAHWDKTQSRELICVCIALCTIVAHNSAHSIPDNFPSYPPDNHHCSDDVYLREGAGQMETNGFWNAFAMSPQFRMHEWSKAENSRSTVLQYGTSWNQKTDQCEDGHTNISASHSITHIPALSSLQDVSSLLPFVSPSTTAQRRKLDLCTTSACPFRQSFKIQHDAIITFNMLYKSSAVAEMGDRARANWTDRWGGCCAAFRGGSCVPI